MTPAQIAQHRHTYNQLRLQLAFPGETVGEYRKTYAPVNVCKDDWTWDDAMAAEDTPFVAHLRRIYEGTYNKLPLLVMGRHEQRRAA